MSTTAIKKKKECEAENTLAYELQTHIPVYLVIIYMFMR